jgi:hypothetical protein
MNEVLDLLRELEKQRFYGSIEIKMEAGRVVLLRETQTLKPGEGRALWSQSRAAQQDN